MSQKIQVQRRVVRTSTSAKLKLLENAVLHWRTNKHVHLKERTYGKGNTILNVVCCVTRVI